MTSLRETLERQVRIGVDVESGPTVADLSAAFIRWARQFFVVRPGGNDSVRNIEDAMRPVLELYGDDAVDAFRGVQLRAVQIYMIAGLDLARTTINARVGRIRRVFRWGVGRGVVSPETLTSLRAVEPLLKGRTDAREPAPIRPVPWWQVQAIEPHASPLVWSLVQVQWWSGCRPGEVCAIRDQDIDRGGAGGTWLFRPARHKSMYRGLARDIWFGPKAVAVLEPMLERWPEVPLTTDRYGYHVRAACRRAGVRPAWSPNRLRHAAATRFRERFGLETTSALLGHQLVETSQVYAERAAAKAMEAAGALG